MAFIHVGYYNFYLSIDTRNTKSIFYLYVGEKKSNKGFIYKTNKKNPFFRGKDKKYGFELGYDRVKYSICDDIFYSKVINNEYTIYFLKNKHIEYLKNNKLIYKKENNTHYTYFNNDNFEHLEYEETDKPHCTIYYCDKERNRKLFSTTNVSALSDNGTWYINHKVALFKEVDNFDKELGNDIYNFYEAFYNLADRERELEETFDIKDINFYVHIGEVNECYSLGDEFTCKRVLYYINNGHIHFI